VDDQHCYHTTNCQDVRLKIDPGERSVDGFHHQRVDYISEGFTHIDKEVKDRQNNQKDNVSDVELEAVVDGVKGQEKKSHWMQIALQEYLASYHWKVSTCDIGAVDDVFEEEGPEDNSDRDFCAEGELIDDLYYFAEPLYLSINTEERF